MEKLIDLHIHSVYSDGEEEPDRLMEMAKKIGLKTVSITDHDTLLGYKNISNHSDIYIISGIELSAKIKRGRMHILGYNFDLNNKQLNDKMNELKENSIDSVIKIIEQIRKDYGIIFPQKEVEEVLKSKGNIGRPNIAKLCVKHGYANYSQEAFNKFLIPAYEKTRSISKGIKPEECIELIKNAGGIPVLAHPHSLELSDKDLLIKIKELIECGLAGIEVYHSHHTDEEIKKYEIIAKNYNLLISGGSDYHGEFVKPDIRMGSGIDGNTRLEELSIVNKIKKKTIQ